MIQSLKQASTAFDLHPFHVPVALGEEEAKKVRVYECHAFVSQPECSVQWLTSPHMFQEISILDSYFHTQVHHKEMKKGAMKLARVSVIVIQNPQLDLSSK